MFVTGFLEMFICTDKHIFLLRRGEIIGEYVYIEWYILVMSAFKCVSFGQVRKAFMISDMECFRSFTVYVKKLI